MTVDVSDWNQVHARLVELARERAALDWEEAKLLIIAQRMRIHAELGYGNFGEYMDRMLGHRGKAGRERLRVAEALAELPKTAEALRDGRVSWSAVRELTRIVCAETEEAWLAAVAERTVREVERLVATHLPGELPTDPPTDEPQEHVLRLEISGATLALFREAQAKLTRDTGGSVDDDDVVRIMARQVLEGAKDPGKSPYQMAIFVCESCGRGWQQGRGERIAVEPEIVEQARCDCLHVGHVDAAAPEKASQEIPPAVRRQVMLRDGGRCVVPGCCNTIVDVHHLDPRAEGGRHQMWNLCVICDGHHRAAHSGRLLVHGSPGSLTFRHADGTRYGGPVAAPVAAAASDAFLALKTLGFKEKEVKRAMAEVLAHVGQEVKLEDLIRQGLRVLCPPGSLARTA